MYDNIGGNFQEKVVKTSASKIPIKIFLIIAGILIVVIVALISIFGNTYKLEMKYTESNIKHFIKGIDSHGDDLDIEIDSISIFDEDSARAYIYVKYLAYAPITLEINFGYGRSGWGEIQYYSSIYCGHADWPSDSIIVAGVAEAMEKMLTGKTEVQENFEQHFGEDETYSYKLGDYYGVCDYSILGGKHFNYKITTNY